MKSKYEIMYKHAFTVAPHPGAWIEIRTDADYRN